PGTLARQSPAGALQLLRGARQQRGATQLPKTGHPALATGAAASQPERPAHLETSPSPRRSMAAPTPHPSPLAKHALRRQNPREEPSALTRTLGSVRGAAGNGGPYRDPSLTAPRRPTEPKVRGSNPLGRARARYLSRQIVPICRDFVLGTRGLSFEARRPVSDSGRLSGEFLASS